MPNMTPEELRLRDKITAIKHRRDYHLMDEPEYVEELVTVFADLCGEVIGPKYQLPSDGKAWDGLRHANQEHEIQFARLTKLTGKEI